MTRADGTSHSCRLARVTRAARVLARGMNAFDSGEPDRHESLVPMARVLARGMNGFDSGEPDRHESLVPMARVTRADRHEFWHEFFVDRHEFWHEG